MIEIIRDEKLGGLIAKTVLELLEDGAELIPTDKSYKIYIRHKDLPSQTKAYFDNWTAEEQAKLIELVNTKKIIFAYPGYFYVKPFFCEK